MYILKLDKKLDDVPISLKKKCVYALEIVGRTATGGGVQKSGGRGALRYTFL